MEVPFDSMATLPYYSPQPKGFVANFFRIDTPAGQQKQAPNAPWVDECVTDDEYLSD